jgi:hypothetical protein
MPGNFVVVFFYTRAGELNCRVTDVVARKTWIVEEAPTLWRFLATPRAPDLGDKGKPIA